MKHEIVSHEQWLAARRALLAEEKAWTRERDRLAEKRRALPWVKVDKDYVFEGAARTGHARRPVRRPQPADRLPLHVRPRLGRGLHRLLAARATRSTARASISSTTTSASSPCPRAPIDKLRGLPPAHGLDASAGSRRWPATSTSTSTSPSPSPRARPACSTTSSASPIPASTSCPGNSVFYRDEDGTIYHTYLELRPRRRAAARGLRLARHGAQGPQRDRARQPDGLGQAPRPLPGRRPHPHAAPPRPRPTPDTGDRPDAPPGPKRRGSCGASPGPSPGAHGEGREARRPDRRSQSGRACPAGAELRLPRPGRRGLICRRTNPARTIPMTPPPRRAILTR